VTTLSPGMAGTVKLCVPEPVLVEEFVARGVAVACEEPFGLTEAMAVTEGSAAAECVRAGEVAGVLVSADVGCDPGVPDRAVAEPPEVAADATAEGVDPPAAQAVRPAPPMTAAMITAGTRHFLMLLPSGK
jgi:hypothetical protein